MSVTVAWNLDVELSIGSIEIAFIKAVTAVPGIITERAALFVAEELSFTQNILRYHRAFYLSDLCIFSL